MTTTLRYLAASSALQPGECSFYRQSSDGVWMMRFRYIRDTDGKPETRIIPVNPNGDACPYALPHGGEWCKWGLRPTGLPGQWRISPSINCKDRISGPNSEPVEIEVWHKDGVTIEGFQDWEAWTT